MIREPYNINPYNQAKDLSAKPQFSFTFGGDALVGYDYQILNNSNKDNVLKNWSYSGNGYIPTVESGLYANNTTALDTPVTLYNDQDYYFNVENINNVSLYNNKGLVWRLRLFEDNTIPSNVIQTGDISSVLSLASDIAKIKGTITGPLEESDKTVFITNSGYDDYTWVDENGEEYQGKIPIRWTRNVMKIGEQDFPIDDYETHMETFFTTSRPDTYYIATELTGQGTQENYYSAAREVVYYTYNYSTSGGNYILTPTKHSYSAPLTRSSFSGIQENAMIRNNDNTVSSIHDKVTTKDLFNASNYNTSESYALESSSKVTKQVTSNGHTTTQDVTYNVMWGNSGAIIKNCQLYNFTVKETTTTYGSDGREIISTNIVPGTRSALGLSNLLYIDPASGSFKNGSSYMTQQEIQAIGKTAVASTTIKLTNAEKHYTLTDGDISFDLSNETNIYTVELEDETIKYNNSSISNTSITRAQARTRGIIDSDKKQLIIKSTTDNSIETSDKFFTYHEVSNFKDNEYGIYTLGKGLSADKRNEVDITTALSSTGTPSNQIFFQVLNNYYDSNYYYFTNQTQPNIYYSIDNTPYYSFESYQQQVEAGNKPTETEPGLENRFLFQKSQTSLLAIDTTIGTEDNPLVTLQRFFPIQASLVGLSYNFKYYSYKIYAGTTGTDGTIIYETQPIYQSEKIFSREVKIEYNNYVTDYDRYKIELTLATSENGFYYYYTYIYPTIDMFQDDEEGDRYAFVSYDEDRGAAKISWTKDNAYPPVTSNAEPITYGTYKVAGKTFPLQAYLVQDDGYMSYYHKGSQVLNINPLHDFQISFALDYVLTDLETITIQPLLAFYDTTGRLAIQLQIVNNTFRLLENNINVTSSTAYVIEKRGSITSLDNIGVDKNQIYQYALPIGTNTLPASGMLASTTVDLKKYCFHFYLFPWSTSSSTMAMSSYKITRFYNVNSSATNDLILQSNDDWRLGFYGEGAGNNANLEDGGNLPSGPDQAAYDTSEYLSVSYLLSGGRPSSQQFIGLSRINLYGNTLYYGIFDVNRRGLISSEDNFILNFNDGIVGFSNLDLKVYGYKIFRNSYENDDVNHRDAAMNFKLQLEQIFTQICGGITMDDSAHTPIANYEGIINDLSYVTSWGGDSGDTPLGYITGAELKAQINSSFDDLRSQMATYFKDLNVSINFYTSDYHTVHSAMDEIYEPDMIDNELIAEISLISNISISEEDGFYYIYDYNVPSRGFYRYQIVPLLADRTYNVLIAKKNDLGESVIEIDDEQWHMTNISLREDGSYAPDTTWSFILGVQSAPFTQTFSKTVQTGFAPYPKIMTSLANYKTTTFSGYLGKFSFGQNGACNSYTDTIAIINDWNDFIYNNNHILVKDPKGHVFIAAVTSSTDTSDITIGEMPTSVSCTLVQVGDTSGFKVYSL